MLVQSASKRALRVLAVEIKAILVFTNAIDVATSGVLIRSHL